MGAGVQYSKQVVSTLLSAVSARHKIRIPPKRSAYRRPPQSPPPPYEYQESEWDTMTWPP